MSHSLKEDKLVPVSEAAKILGVSIDTIRRRDKTGILHSERLDGKNRYFSIEELEEVKFSKPLSITDASHQLGISPSTLRRLEDKGLIKPDRSLSGERIYTKKTLEKFLHSEYFLRQKEVTDKILEPLVKGEVSQKREETTHKILGAVQEEVREEVSKLTDFKKSFYLAGISLATLFVFVVSVLTVLFLLFPKETAEFLGFRENSRTLSQSKGAAILGARFQPGQAVSGSVLGTALKPFGQISLGLVSKISPETYRQIVPEKAIQDVNEVLTIDSRGNLSPLATIRLPDSSYLEVPDNKLIENLNAQFLEGKSWGDEEGDIVTFGAGGQIPGLQIPESNLLEASVNSRVIKNSSIATEDLADKAITSAKLADGVAVSVTDDSILSKHIKDGEVKTGELADGAVTSAKISDNTITTSDLASTLTFSAGDLLDLSAIVHDSTAKQGLLLPNVSSSSPSSPTAGEGYLAYDTSGDQVLFYNGSSWGGVGSGDITAVTAGTGLSGGGTSGAVTLNVDTSSSLTWSAAQTFSGNVGVGGLLTLSSSGITGGGLSSTCNGSTQKLLWNSSNNQFDCGTDLNTGGGGGAGGWVDYGSTIGLSTITSNVGIGTSQSVANAKLHIQGGGNSTGLTLLTNNSSNSQFGLVVLDNGNVGVGTTLPSYNFQVSGTGNFGNVGVGGSLVTTGNVGIGGSLTVTSGTTLSSFLTVSGITTLNGPFTLGDNGDTGSINTSDWDISATGDLTGIGAITADGLLTLSGSNAALTFSGTTPSLTSGSNLLGLFAGGNVGVGTTGNVYGALTVKGLGTSTGITLQTYGSNLTQGLTVLDNGNVGVGTTLPSYNFQVSGTGNFGNVGVGGSLVTTGNVGIGGSLTVTSGLSLLSGSVLNSYLANSAITVSATAGTGLSISGSPVSLGGTLTVAGIDASDSVKGVASFNSTNFSVTSGAVNTIQDIATTSTPTFSTLTLSGNNKALVFSGTTPSISTNSNNSFSIFANSGNVGIGTSGNVYGALTVKGLGTSTGITLQTYGSNLTQGLTVLDNGNVGVGTTLPSYNFQVSGTSNFGNVGVGGSLVVTGNVGIGGSLTLGSNSIIKASGNATIVMANTKSFIVQDDSGNQLVVYNDTTNALTIGDSSNGFTFDIDTGPSFAGTARPAKTLTLSPEYAGAVLTAFYGGGTDTNITGSMTSDAETSATNNLRTYYQWERTTDATLHYYTVAVRVTLPSDFSVWATSNALVVNFVTDTTGTTANVLDVYVYLESNSTTAVASSTGNASGTADTWTSVAVDDSTLDDASAPEWDAAGETAIIYLRMGSASSEYARVGDIQLNYLGGF